MADYEKRAVWRNTSSFIDSNLSRSAGNFFESSAEVPPSPFTHEQFQDAHLILFVIYPILLSICTVGNSLNLVVLHLQRPKTSANVYMVTMAVTDMLTMWFYLPYYLNNLGVVFDDVAYRPKDHRRDFHRFRGMQIWIAEVAYDLCDWVLLAFSLERLLVISHPFRFRKLQTVSAAGTIIFVLCAIACLFKVHHLVQYYWILPEEQRLNHTARSQDTAMKHQPIWLMNWNDLQDQAETADIFVKFIALLVINVMLAVQIKVHGRSATAKQRAAQDTRSVKKQRAASAVLAGSVLLYLVTQFPMLVYLCLIQLDRSGAYEFRPLPHLYGINIANSFMFANYSLNFLVYLVASETYRREFQKIFALGRCLRYLISKRQKPAERALVIFASRKSGSSFVSSTSVQRPRQPVGYGQRPSRITRLDSEDGDPGLQMKPIS